MPKGGTSRADFGEKLSYINPRWLFQNEGRGGKTKVRRRHNKKAARPYAVGSLRKVSSTTAK